MGQLTVESSESSVVVCSTRQEPHSILRRCVKYAAVICMLGLFLAFTTYVIPVYLKGNVIDTSGTDVITSVIAGAALRLDCGSLAHTAGTLLQVTWRKDMVAFYQQYSSGGRYRGHQTGELGERLADQGRLESHLVGQITLFPALPMDEGTYMCEVARVSNEVAGTEVLRKSFGVSVVSGPQLDMEQAGQIFACAFLAAVFVISGIRLAQRRQKQTLEIMTPPKPEEIPDDDEEFLPKSGRSLSRSNRSRPGSVRRRSGSARSSTKASSIRKAPSAHSSVTRVSRRDVSSSRDARASHRSISTTSVGVNDVLVQKPQELRAIQSCTSGKISQREPATTPKKGPVRKTGRNKARQGRVARK